MPVENVVPFTPLESLAINRFERLIRLNFHTTSAIDKGQPTLAHKWVDSENTPAPFKSDRLLVSALGRMAFNIYIQQEDPRVRAIADEIVFQYQEDYARNKSTTLQKTTT